MRKKPARKTARFPGTGKNTANFPFTRAKLRISRQIRKILKNNSGLTAE
jgi:hypothetical protein